MQDQATDRVRTRFAAFPAARPSGGAGTGHPASRGRAAAVAALILSSACGTAELQSARLAGPGNFEITPGLTVATVSGDGESERTATQFGVRVATGLTSGIDLRLRYEYIDIAEDGGEGFNIAEFGPKFGLVADRLAIHAPVGFAFGGQVTDRSESLVFRPTVLFTHPISDQIELTTAGKGFIWLNDDSLDNLLGADLGLGLSTDLERWVFRPEFGFLKNPGEDGTLWHWSVGFTLYPGDEN